VTEQLSPNAPSRAKRWAVAIAVGIVCTAIVIAFRLKAPSEIPDLAQVWFGARAMLENRNPYDLIGPGLEFEWEWRLFYPATALVAAIPLAGLPLLGAVAVFVFLSCVLLAYGVTALGWHRLALFCSMPMVFALLLVQWSPILTATWLLPPLAFLLAAKPNIGLALLASSDSLRVFRWAIGGGLALLAISLALDPGWLGEWLRWVGQAEHRPPILRWGGPLVLLALLRWKRPEARLIVALACVPQYAYWYEVVPLMLVPVTRTETYVFSLVTSLGWMLEGTIKAPPTAEGIHQVVGALMVAFAYLPAVIMVLRRPNEWSRDSIHLKWINAVGETLRPRGTKAPLGP
jgi:hypothetical protein